MNISSPVSLVVGSPESAYLEGYRSSTDLRIIEADEEWELLKQEPVRRRASWNYWRCLALQPLDRDLLLLEDDIQFAQGWLSRFLDTTAVINARYGCGYVLSLYSAHPFCGYAYAGGAMYAEFPPQSFYGTQATYYPAAIRTGFAQYLRKHGVDEFREPYDLLLGRYVAENRHRLIVTAPSLVQHIGEETTGLGSFYHRAACFSESL